MEGTTLAALKKGGVDLLLAWILSLRNPKGKVIEEGLGRLPAGDDFRGFLERLQKEEWMRHLMGCQIVPTDIPRIIEFQKEGIATWAEIRSAWQYAEREGPIEFKLSKKLNRVADWVWNLIPVLIVVGMAVALVTMKMSLKAKAIIWPGFIIFLGAESLAIFLLKSFGGLMTAQMVYRRSLRTKPQL
jgi:hypothetical protein